MLPDIVSKLVRPAVERPISPLKKKSSVTWYEPLTP
jgi:hypothetical protein